jgi:hypothetical protein
MTCDSNRTAKHAALVPQCLRMGADTADQREEGLSDESLSQLGRQTPIFL